MATQIHNDETVILADDAFIEFGIGGPAKFGWETADPNANVLLLALPVGGAIDVPVFVIGNAAVKAVDLGFFNGITEPRLAVVDVDRNSWVALGFNADNDARIMIGGSAVLTLPALTLGGTIAGGNRIVNNLGTIGIGTTAFIVNDAASTARYAIIAKSDANTIVGRPLASLVISNLDTTTDNTAGLIFAANTGASTIHFASAEIVAIFGARTNGQYPTGQLVFMTSSTLNSAPTEKMRISNTGKVSFGVAGTVQGLIGISGATSGTVDIAVAAAAGTWTMTLPAAVGGAGEQLTDAAGNGVTSWAAAASIREAKTDITPVTNGRDVLDMILGTQVYKFRYQQGRGTLDTDTQYVGLMADEAPWAMHYKGGIVNPVNTLGYAMLGIQATNQRIDELEAELTKFRQLVRR